MKYKNCCQHKTSWRDHKLTTGAGIALLLILGIVLIGLAFSRGGDDSARQSCPPGQVFSEAHGHCH